MTQERKLTDDIEAREKFRKIGVVVFIRNLHGQILLTRENKTHDTDGGIVDQYSVLCETSEDGEDWAETLLRGLKEELGDGGENENFVIDPYHSLVGESLFAKDVLARVVVIYYIKDPNQIFSSKGDGETTPLGWFYLHQFDSADVIKRLRPGVRGILNECIKKSVFTPDPFRDFVSLSLDNLRNLSPYYTR